MNLDRLLLQNQRDSHCCKKNIGRSLSLSQISLLTSISHPNIVGYYHTHEQEMREIVFDYCEFGSFSDIVLCKHELDSHDLWSIRNQILEAVKFLSFQGLYHKGLNVSNVLIYSLHPISIKLSLLSNSDVLLGSINPEVPIEVFFRHQSSLQDVCIDNLIRSIVKLVFPYSILGKCIIFANPNTLERDDAASVKALICSIESTALFKSTKCIGDFPCVNNSLSFLSKYFQSRKETSLYFSNALIFHVFIQAILMFEKPLISFSVQSKRLYSKNKDFSDFATKSISVSSCFRDVFFRAFDFVCDSRGHSLILGNHYLFSDCILSSWCSTISDLSNPSVVLFSWWKKFFVTAIRTSTLNFDKAIIDSDKVTELELANFNEDLAHITVFPNLSSFSLSFSYSFLGFDVLASCQNLRSVHIERCTLSDLTPFCFIARLTTLSLFEVDVADFSPLTGFNHISELSLDYCKFHRLSMLSSLKQLTYLSLTENRISDLTPLESLNQLTQLLLNDNRIVDISPLRSLTRLVELSLNGNQITDLTPLSSLKHLTQLFLSDNEVYDLGPLKHFSKLSTLDVTKTVLPVEHRRELTDRSDVKTLINSFQHGVFGLDFSAKRYVIDLSFYSHCSMLKSLNLSHKSIRNISEISKFSNLEILDLSNSVQAHDIGITDVSFLSCCVKLKSLSLNGSKVTDLSFLSTSSDHLKCLSLNNTLFSSLSQLCPLKNLEFLSLNDNSIDDIFPLSSLHNLQFLSLCNNNISDLSPLSCLQRLQKLVFDDNKFTGLDLSPLSLLSKLECLSLRGNQVCDVLPLQSITKLSILR
ncbi:hypothetical protein RCL1_000216 [Eukaryota sp. TZLM3-RCL]